MSVLYDTLNEWSEKYGRNSIGQETVIRFEPHCGNFWLMSREDLGWGEYGREFESLWKLFAEWKMKIVGDGKDKHSAFIRVRPVEGN